MDPAMRAKIDAARKANERSKTMDGGEFPPDPPPGVYEARIQTAKVFVSSTGKPMLQRVFVIEGGESHGMQARDFLNLEQDFLIARLRAFIESHGYEMPDELFDYEACESEDTWVFVPELVDIVSAIEGENREYKIEFSQRIVGDRAFNSVAILEVGDAEDGAPKPGSKPKDEEPDEDTESDDDAEASEDEDDEVLRTELLAFCVDEGGVEEAEDDMDLDTLKEKIGEYVFWPDTITKAQLATNKDLKGEDPKDGISAESVELLERAGLGSCVFKPKKPAKKKTAGKKRSK